MSLPAILVGTTACWLLLFATDGLTAMIADEVSPAEAARVQPGPQTQPSVPVPRSDRSESADDTPQEGELNSSRRDRIRTVGVLLLGLVVVLGGFAMAFSVIWGGRLRRIIRRNPAEPTDYDPFWYLRKRSAPADQAKEAPASETEVDPPGEPTGDGRS